VQKASAIAFVVRVVVGELVRLVFAMPLPTPAGVSRFRRAFDGGVDAAFAGDVEREGWCRVDR
jgi:hypothetical protein